MNPELELLPEIKGKMLLLREDLLTGGEILSFFGLFLRDNSQNKWDVVVAAPWIDEDKRTAIALLADKLNTRLNSEEILAISRIVTVNSSDPLLKYYNDKFFSEPGSADFAVAHGISFFNMQMDTAVLFRPTGNALSTDKQKK
jgi:hypothetical protein